jgi:tetratricopeptide (TPR) repeat protein
MGKKKPRKPAASKNGKSRAVSPKAAKKTAARKSAKKQAKMSPKQAANQLAASAAEWLAKKDWQRAITNLASSLQFDPFRADWTALLDRALDMGGKKVAAFLKKSDNEPYIGFEAIKARAAYRRGDFKTAFNELENLTHNFPESRFAEAWGISWVTEKTVRKAGREVVVRFLVSIVHNRYPEPDQMTDFCRTQANRAIAALELVERVAGGDEMTVLFKGQMLSKAGRFGDAIKMAEREAEKNPTFRTATAAAMAHKRNGNTEKAVEWFRRASDLDTKNETCLLDIGDIRTDEEKWQQAIEAYEEAMRRVPNHDWAYPSAVYCRYRKSGNPKLLEELRYMANAGPDECGMASIMKQMFGGYNFEDRRMRAEALMKRVEPNFVPTHRPHEHDHDEEEHEEK